MCHLKCCLIVQCNNILRNSVQLGPLFLYKKAFAKRLIPQKMLRLLIRREKIADLFNIYKSIFLKWSVRALTFPASV